MRHFFALFLAACAMGALAGCNGSTTSPSTDPNKAEAQSVAAADPTADPDLAGINNDAETIEAAAGGVGTAAPLSVVPDSINLCWYRHLRHTSRTTTATGDTSSMLVTLTRHNDGTLVGRLCDNHGRGHGHGEGAVAEPESALFRKGYKVTWIREAQYTKLPHASDEDGEDGSRWVLMASTVAHTQQDSPSVANQPVIVSVTISGQDSAGNPVSYTFDDPNALIDPATLPRFAPGDPVTVTVITNDAANQAAFIHFDQASAFQPKLLRRPLAYNGSNGFTGQFDVRAGHGQGHWRGRRARQALWVDVLNKDSLRDTEAPYAAAGWGLPYRLRPPHDGAMALNRHE